MYFYLKGRVVEIYNNFIVLDVNNIGYKIYVINPSFYFINEDYLIYILHIIKENDEYFIGFNSLDEKEFFEKLISCKGIGPKIALNALKNISIPLFIKAIEEDDIKTLKKLDGIGPKAASQIILDLKGKVVSSKEETSLNTNQEEALIGLTSLGFKQKEILECFKKINNNSLSTEEYISLSLKMIRWGNNE